MGKCELESLVRNNLLLVLQAMENQKDIATYYPPEMQPFTEQIDQIREYIDVAGEFAIAYESIVANLELFPFVLTGSEVVSLLEVGLIMQYKTEREQDHIFDKRR